MFGDTSGSQTWWGAAGIQWVEARAAAEHVAGHRTVPPTKTYPAPNVHHTEVRKLCPEETHAVFM